MSKEPVLLGVLKQAIVEYADRMARQKNQFNKTKRMNISDFLSQAIRNRKSTSSFTLGLFSSAEVRKDSIANGVFSELVSELMLEILRESRVSSEAQ